MKTKQKCRIPKFFLALLAMTTTTSGFADELEVALSSKTVKAEYLRPVDQAGIGGGDLSVGLFYNEDEELAGNVGLVVSGVPAGQNPLSFGVGTKFYGARVKRRGNDSVFALTLGGKAKYTFPANIPMHLGTELFYAPSITTLSDGENLLDFNARYEIEFIPQTVAFIGYRLFRVDLEKGGYSKLDNNAQLGIRMSF
jgi:hypothetical protein